MKRAKFEMYDAKGIPKPLKFGAKIRVFDFGLVYYGHIRDILIDSGGAIWIQGSYAKDTDDRVIYVVLFPVHLLGVHALYLFCSISIAVTFHLTAPSGNHRTV
ncbi:MAG: hypothetical protein GY820_20120 [Gammaproteobacteria bacterium]|nr:hypothetical protein [Gammaproteobacteria bacterium]